MNVPENNAGEELLEASQRVEANTATGDTGRRFILKRWWRYRT